jgi:hypothetical protein
VPEARLAQLRAEVARTAPVDVDVAGWSVDVMASCLGLSGAAATQPVQERAARTLVDPAAQPGGASGVGAARGADAVWVDPTTPTPQPPPRVPEGRHDPVRLPLGVAAAVGMIGVFVLGSWLTNRHGVVPVSPHQILARILRLDVGEAYLATDAATIAIGFALPLRAAVQDLLGKKIMIATVVAGALVSASTVPVFLSYVEQPGRLAVSLLIAFLVGLLVSAFVYTPLRGTGAFGGRRWAGAVLVSCAAGALAYLVSFYSVLSQEDADVYLSFVGSDLVGMSWGVLIYLAAGGLTAALLRRRSAAA